jgi:hypothetical protein
MFKVLEMLRDKKLLFTVDTIDSTRDGELPILTNILRKKVRDGMENSDSTSTDHCSSDQDSQ